MSFKDSVQRWKGFVKNTLGEKIFLKSDLLLEKNFLEGSAHFSWVRSS